MAGWIYGDGKVIKFYLFDYKSSGKAAEEIKKQLYFYAYVLSRIYKTAAIKCFAVYPFQKTIREYPYDTNARRDISPMA